MEKKTKYALILKEEIYKTQTRCSAYLQKNTKKIKTCGPIDWNGRRYKLDYETGEMNYYELENIQANKYNSLERTKRMLNMLLEVNEFDWFCTLTFDNNRIKRNDDNSVFEAYVKYINNIKKQYPALRYISVPERHEDGSIHFHLLIGGVSWQKLGLVNSGKVCCHWATKRNKDGSIRNVKACSFEFYEKTKHLHQEKDTDGLTIYNITSFIYGITTATRIQSREKCNSYIKKYISKDFGTTDKYKKRFYYSSNLNVPRQVKQCIGADFESPEDVIKLLESNPLFENAETKCYLEKYNIAVFRIDNELKSNLEKGLILTNELTPFDTGEECK